MEMSEGAWLCFKWSGTLWEEGPPGLTQEPAAQSSRVRVCPAGARHRLSMFEVQRGGQSGRAGEPEEGLEAQSEEPGKQVTRSKRASGRRLPQTCQLDDRRIWHHLLGMCDVLGTALNVWCGQPTRSPRQPREFLTITQDPPGSAAVTNCSEKLRHSKPCRFMSCSCYVVIHPRVGDGLQDECGTVWHCHTRGELRRGR